MAAVPDAVPRSTRPYRVPDLLQDIRLLDLLELSGTTVQASALLNLSQPTVSRRYRLLAKDFGLQRHPRQLQGCRFGATEAMRLLRLGCRAHRLAAGVARIGADVLHQPLLEEVHGLLPVPVRFRTIEAWAELVREGVLDGAIVSGLELQRHDLPDARELDLINLGLLSLSLAMAPPIARSSAQTPTVLVPDKSVALGLRRSLAQRGLSLKTANSTCQTPSNWLQCLEGSSLAMPMPELAPASWWQSLHRLPLPEPLVMPTWLLLPIGWQQQPFWSHTAERLRCHPGFCSGDESSAPKFLTCR